ncbi:MAG: energy transducer TonB [Candidatus Krumholzibacteriota bacterium]|nr:energy transducer TonB [Candidatus Krumholzibacteriota bacterium]
MSPEYRKNIFRHDRGSKEWITIISAALILHIALFLLLKPEYLEIFRTEVPGDKGISDYSGDGRTFSLIPYPDEVIIPELDLQPDEPAVTEQEKQSVFEEFGDVDLNIEPLAGNSANRGSSSRSGTKRNNVEPKPLFIPWPKYPENIKKDVDGKVELLLYVNEKGEVTEIKLSRGLPQNILNETAIAAAREIRFIPGEVKGVPTPMWIRFTIGFQPR